MVASNTTSNLLFTSHSSVRGAISPQLMPTTPPQYFHSVQIILHEYFFDEILLDEKKRITIVASLCLPGDDVHTLSEKN